MSETFGERLRRLRTARGMRVVDVAYAVGITEGVIRQIEAADQERKSGRGPAARKAAQRDAGLPGDRD